MPTPMHITFARQSPLLKILKESPKDFSNDDSGMNPQFETHLFLIDKDTEFSIQ